jgi:hypothetical protein
MPRDRLDQRSTRPPKQNRACLTTTNSVSAKWGRGCGIPMGPMFRGSGGQDPKPTMSWSFPLTAEIGYFVMPPRQWRSNGTWASADKPKRWPNATEVIVAGRARTASKPITASVIGWTTAALGCSSWATRQAAPPMGGLKEPTGSGSMRTTITLSPKNTSSIRRSDLSTAGADEGDPTIGLVVPGSETDRMFGRVGSARLSLSTGTSPRCVGTLSAGRAAKLRYCGEHLVGLVSVADGRVVVRQLASSLRTTVPSRRRRGRLSPRSAVDWRKVAAWVITSSEPLFALEYRIPPRRTVIG